MAKQQIKIRYVSWREGRPRFEPGKNLRDLGYRGQDLRHEDGRWFTAGEATDWSLRLAAEIEARQAEAATPVKPAAKASRPARLAIYPVKRLVEDWQQSPAFSTDISERTRKDYRYKLSVLEREAPDIWAAELDSLDRQIAFGLYEDLRARRGLSMANGIMRVLSTACSWGLRRGKFRARETNPCSELGLAEIPPRVRFATRAELTALVATADALGLPEMADSFLLAVWTGQRQADRLALTVRKRLNGRIILRQSKTGAIVSVPEARELASRLTAAAARRRAANVMSSQVILNERTWAPFGQSYYSHLFGEIRAVASAGLWRKGQDLYSPTKAKLRYLTVTTGEASADAVEIVAACSSVADIFEMDFRDTAVTWMALAGATIPEIIAVTGHTAQSATQILKHYLARHPEMADSAIRKMSAWFDEGGETEFGF